MLVARILLVFPRAGGFSRIPERTWEVKSFFVQAPSGSFRDSRWGIFSGRCGQVGLGRVDLLSNMSASKTSLHELSAAINHQDLPGDLARFLGAQP